MRLVGGLTNAEGRVEVNYEGTWGTVCYDSSWDLNDAMVVCRMLGYSAVLAAHVKYGEGSGAVWMSNLVCSGSEKNISECLHIGWGETSCGHSQDAGVTCGSESWNCFECLLILYLVYDFVNLVLFSITTSTPVTGMAYSTFCSTPQTV